MQIIMDKKLNRKNNIYIDQQFAVNELLKDQSTQDVDCQ